MDSRSDVEEQIIQLFKQYYINEIAKALTITYEIDPARAHSLVCSFKNGEYCTHFISSTVPHVTNTKKYPPTVSQEIYASFVLYWDGINSHKDTGYFKGHESYNRLYVRNVNQDNPNDYYREPLLDGVCAVCSREIARVMLYQGRLLCSQCRKDSLPQGYVYHKKQCECGICIAFRAGRRQTRYAKDSKTESSAGGKRLRRFKFRDCKPPSSSDDV